MGQSIPFGQHIARPPMSARVGAEAWRSGVCAVDDMVHGGWCRERDDRRAVGHFLAHVDWARHVLDAGAHHDSDDRACWWESRART